MKPRTLRSARSGNQAADADWTPACPHRMPRYARHRSSDDCDLRRHRSGQVCRAHQRILLRMAVYGRGEGPRGGLPAHRSAAAAVAGPAGRTGPRLTSRPRCSSPARCAASSGTAPRQPQRTLHKSGLITQRDPRREPDAIADYGQLTTMPSCADDAHGSADSGRALSPKRVRSA
jgi:hypothetical protein